MKGSRVRLAIVGAVATTLVWAVACGSSRGIQPRHQASALRSSVPTRDAIVASPPTWGPAHPGFGEMAFAPDGTMYVTDPVNGRIYRVSHSGHTTVYGGSGPGRHTRWRYIPRWGWTAAASYGGDGQHPTDALFAFPVGIAFDAAGDMVVADHLNSRIREIDTDGFVSTVAGVGPGFDYWGPWTPGVGPEAGDGGPAVHGILDAPWVIAVDPAGNLFIADRDHDAIREVDTNGTLTTVAGTGRAGFNGDGRQAATAKLSRPVAVAFDAAGHLYISDENNYRIREVNNAGIISTVAGNGHYGCGGDGGPAVDASFKNPGDIVFAPDGSLIISDGECFRIRRVAPDGTISTLAGTGSHGCGGVGRPVSKLRIAGDVSLQYGPDGDLYIGNCNRIIRVDSSGMTHLFATAPKKPAKH